MIRVKGFKGFLSCFSKTDIAQMEERALGSAAELLANEETIHLLDSCLLSTQQDVIQMQQKCKNVETAIQGSFLCFCIVYAIHRVHMCRCEITHLSL